MSTKQLRGTTCQRGRLAIVLAAAALLAASAGAQSLPVTNGLTLWLKADAISGLGNGQAVTNWLDSSPNGYNAVNTAGMQPLFETGVQHGLPVVRFNGPTPPALGDYLTTPGIPALTHMSVFLVSKPFDVLNRYVVAFGDNVHDVIENFNGPVWEWFQTPRTTLAPVNTTKFQIVSFTGGSSVANPWVIGNDAGPTNPSFSSAFNGDIAELIVYDRTLTGAEAWNVTEYLNAKWAIPEPSTLGLLGLGAAFLWRKRRS